MKALLILSLVIGSMSAAHAQEMPFAGGNSSAPITINADSLSVDQNNETAVFTGNVVAVQNDLKLSSDSMTVYYRQKKSTGQNAISKIVVQGKVLFTTPEETAQGANGVYEVDKKILTLTDNVVLTRGQNVLRGSKLVYNMATKKSNLIGGTSTDIGGKTKGGRVQGIFVPDNAK